MGSCTYIEKLEIYESLQQSEMVCHSSVIKGITKITPKNINFNLASDSYLIQSISSLNCVDLSWNQRSKTCCLEKLINCDI